MIKHLENAINTHYNSSILQEWMVCIVRVNYKKLWVMCAEKEMSKAELRNKQVFPQRPLQSSERIKKSTYLSS